VSTHGVFGIAVADCFVKKNIWGIFSQSE